MSVAIRPAHQHRLVVPKLVLPLLRHPFSNSKSYVKAFSTSTHNKQIEVMLAKAVQKHEASLPPPTSRKPSTTLSQQLFPSSSPNSSQALKSPFHQSGIASKALRPSASAVVNGTTGYANTSKRIAVPENGSGISSGKQDPRYNRSMRDSTSGKEVVDLTQQSSNLGSGIVGRLHDAVYFDENDFVDDADLDLDDDSVPVGSGFAISTGMLPISSKNVSSSSVPIAWSSSPLNNKTAPSNTLAPHERALLDNIDSDGVAVRPAKRRKLPWLDTDQPQSQPEPRSPPLPTSFRAKKKTGSLAFTPLPKDKTNVPYPWNKTASAVKEEQKRHRQQSTIGKRTVQTIDDIGEESSVAKTERKNEREEVSRIFLSEEQKKVFSLVVEEKKSVFFTGSAGTGKSVLMREIISHLRTKHHREPGRVAVTASTGLAACNIGGVTLHNFGGIGLGKDDAPTLIKKIKRNIKAKNRWTHTKVLIIDEISMVDGDLFDKLESIARSIRGNARPFGGIQLIITGDFFQLPPVPDSGRVAKFAFDANTWTTSINHTIGLTQVFRQKDPDFANMLNEMRLGKLSGESIAKFRQLDRPLKDGDTLATELFSTRNEVDNANNARMMKLGGTAVTFNAEDGGSIQDPQFRDNLLKNCMAPPQIVLKKGAQVMLIKNMDDNLVNGSIGKVVMFMDEKLFSIYHEHEEDFQFDQTQEVDEDALSRRSKLKAMLNSEVSGSTSKKWPLVRFPLADGNFRDLLCEPETWKLELPNGEVQASRTQVPLILAWALSIHKAQGQTLKRVKVDLGKIFEKGQAYVALSRAVTKEGLQITRFDPRKVMAHDRVRVFYESLYNVT